jgi:hypothetical protein
MIEVDPRERLEKGRAAALAGHYSEALHEYIWFHNNALKYDPALYGVRLSYALHDWAELGEVYPKALDALKEVRARKTEQLLSGKKETRARRISRLATGKHAFNLFHDVVAINDRLNDQKWTCALFRKLDRVNPEFAKTCAFPAFDALIACKEFSLAYRYCDDTEDALLRFSDDLNERIANMDKQRNTRAPILDAYTRIYCRDITTRAKILTGVGKTLEASALMQWAEALVHSAVACKRVARVLFRT